MLIGFTNYPEPQLSTLLYSAYDVIINPMFNKDLFLKYVEYYDISEQIEKSVEALGCYFEEHGFTYVIKELFNKINSISERRNYV